MFTKLEREPIQKKNETEIDLVLVALNFEDRFGIFPQLQKIKLGNEKRISLVKPLLLLPNNIPSKTKKKIDSCWKEMYGAIKTIQNPNVPYNELSIRPDAKTIFSTGIFIADLSDGRAEILLPYDLYIEPQNMPQTRDTGNGILLMNTWSPVSSADLLSKRFESNRFGNIFNLTVNVQPPGSQWLYKYSYQYYLNPNDQ